MWFRFFLNLFLKLPIEGLFLLLSLDVTRMKVHNIII